MENSIMDENSGEKIIIENRYKLNKAIMKDWVRENKTVTESKICWISLTILFIAIGTGCIISNGEQYTVWFFACAIYCLYRGIFRYNLMLEKECKQRERLYKKSEWERRILFFDDHIAVIEENTIGAKMQYSDITDIENDGECIKLKMSAGGWIRIYKNGFIGSDFARCQEFLNKKISAF